MQFASEFQDNMAVRENVSWLGAADLASRYCNELFDCFAVENGMPIAVNVVITPLNISYHLNNSYYDVKWHSY
jgi:hypothetical protein